jgi:predicted nicotinamide N-methyase
MVTDRELFIRTHTRLGPVPFVPEIRLFIADDSTALWHSTEDELGQAGLPPPFWAFAWAGGQALARYLLDHCLLVRDKKVLDFASGSGLVAIAAAKAGANTVEASEIDEFALTAIGMNARANDVSVEVRAGDIVGRDEGWDVILAGDVAYERDMASRAIAWLGGLDRRGACVLFGDPGRAYLDRKRLHPIASYPIPVTRDLEDAQLKETAVWRFGSAPL